MQNNSKPKTHSLVVPASLGERIGKITWEMNINKGRFVEQALDDALHALIAKRNKLREQEADY